MARRARTVTSRRLTFTSTSRRFVLPPTGGFATRSEWERLTIALGTTAAIVGVSMLLFGPGDWLAWLGVLASPQEPAPGSFTIVTAPLVARIFAAGVLVWWGARRDYPWTVLAAAMITQPSVWQHTLSMAVGFLWLVRSPAIAQSDQPSSAGTAYDVAGAEEARVAAG